MQAVKLLLITGRQLQELANVHQQFGRVFTANDPGVALRANVMSIISTTSGPGAGRIVNQNFAGRPPSHDALSSQPGHVMFDRW